MLPHKTRTGLVFSYITFNIPFVIWIMIGFFEGLPRELDESALIDGCTRLGSFLRITIPISLPGMLSAGVFCFVLSWNEFLFALILTGNGRMAHKRGVASLSSSIIEFNQIFDYQQKRTLL